MSWYTDPQLFICSLARVYRITKDSSTNPILSSDLFQEHEWLSFSKHLSLGNNKLEDYEAIKECFRKPGHIKKFINCQGLVINYDYNIEKGTWSIEEPSSPFWRLPGITRPRSDAEKVSDMEVRISSLQDEVERNKVEKEAADKRLSDLEAQNAVLQDLLQHEIDRNKVEKTAAVERLLDSEAEIFSFQDNHEIDLNNFYADLRGKVDRNKAEQAAVDKRVKDLEAQNANLGGKVDSMAEKQHEIDLSNFYADLRGKIDRNKVEQAAVDQRVEHLETQNAKLRGKVNRNKAQKAAVDKRVKDLEEQKAAVEKRVMDLTAENATLRALEKQVSKKSDVINADMLARLTALEKHVLDLPTKLADQCYVAAGEGSSMEEPWVTVDAD